MSASRLVPALDGYRTRVAAHWVFILILVLVIGLLVLGWERAPRTLRVFVPALIGEDFVNPDRRDASIVFAFAMQTQIALNRWVRDGEADYKANIERLQARFTPRHREALLVDYARRQGRGERSANELRNRVRWAKPIPGWDVYRDELVEIREDGSWVVTVALEIEEMSSGISVKHIAVRYPFVVEPMRIDPEHNEMALGVAGFPDDARPRDLTAEELEAAGITLDLNQEPS